MTRAEPFMGEDDDRFLPVVPFVPFRCPKCGSAKPITHAVRGMQDGRTSRQHRCQSCGQRYQSIEIKRDQMAQWVRDNDRPAD